MAIDQQNISSTLASMKDDVLRQYGAMHKNDPYIFPLVFQESQNRQRLRMQQQAAQGMQPQPKVNEQALAQMAPPQARPMPQRQGQGIVDLSAPNMETMADGGIAGYPDDDFVTRNQSVVMMAEGGHVPRYQGNPRDGSVVRMPYGGNTMGMPDPTQEALSALQAEEAGAATARTRKIAELEQQVAFLTAAGAPQAATVKAQLDALKSPATASPTDPNFRRQEDPRMKPGVAATAQPLLTSDAAPKVDTTRQTKPAAEAARKEPAQATTDVMGMFNQALKTADEKPNPLEARLKEINAEKVKAGEENVAGIEAIQKKFDDIYKGKKDRLSNKEGEIAKMDKQVLGLAAVLAGARMMQTRGSIGEAIGAGIDTGTKQYITGQDKINAAKDKLSDARDRLEELEAQRGEMSARELHKARNEVKTLTVAGMENLVQAAMAERKMNRTEAVDFVKAQLTVSTADKDRASREGIARLQASSGNRNNQLELLQALQADPKLMAAYRTMQGKNEDVMGQYNDYLKANPALALDPKAAFTQFLMTKSAFAQLGAPTVTDKAAGPVRKQP